MPTSNENTSGAKPHGCRRMRSPSVCRSCGGAPLTSPRSVALQLDPSFVQGEWRHELPSAHARADPTEQYDALREDIVLRGGAGAGGP